MITYIARMKCKPLMEFDGIGNEKMITNRSSSESTSFGTNPSGNNNLFVPPKGRDTADKDIITPNDNAKQDQSVLSRGLPLLTSKAYQTIYKAAQKYNKPFTYDDIIPLLKEQEDWLPKTPTLERYLRTLSQHGLLIRIKKGIYIIR